MKLAAVLFIQQQHNARALEVKIIKVVWNVPHVRHWVIFKTLYQTCFEENRVTSTIASTPHAEDSQKCSASSEVVQIPFLKGRVKIFNAVIT